MNTDLCKHREFGYACFGPLLLQFERWLCQAAAEREVDALFFLSREGYFLKAAHEKLVSLGLNGNARPLPYHYLLTSRRAVFGAVEKTPESLQTIVESGGFRHGSLRELVRIRLGESAARLLPRDLTVSLPQDNSLVLDLLIKLIPELNQVAERERAAFRTYLGEVGLLRTAHAGLVDLGYSGSMQRHLPGIAGVRLTGFYFATTSRVDSWRGDANQAMACFGRNCDYGRPQDSPFAVFRHHLALESWLTSPDPQLVCFDDAGKPVFAKAGAMQLRFDLLQAINAGVLDYFEDVARLGSAEDDISWFAQEVMATALFAPQYADIIRSFSVEDNFCGNDEIDVAQRLAECSSAPCAVVDS